MPEMNPQRTPAPTRRWKRTAAALLLLAGGAVVNVAVAWGFAVLSAQDTWRGNFAREAPRTWPLYLQRLDWPPPDTATERKIGGIGVRVIDISGGDTDASWKQTGPGSDKTWVSLEVRQFGIPTRALQWETHGVRAGPRGMVMVKAAHEAAGFRTGIDISRTRPDGSINERRLPLIPLYPGFIINTLVYALLLRLLFFAPFAARRMLRRRRGLCENCAYPIGTWGTPVCTECGAAVSQKERIQNEPRA